MTTPSPDDKILQLVRAILDAVDTRLAAVRQEFATTVQQMEQRHRQVLDALAAFDRRLAALQSDQGATRPAPGTAPAAAPATAPASTPTLRVGPPASAGVAPAPAPTPAPTPAPAPAPQGDVIDLAEVARLVEERLGSLQLPSLDQRPGG